MLGITFSPQNYHHHQQFLSKLRENNENDMTSAVWAGTVFGPRLWPLSACRHSLAETGYPSWMFVGEKMECTIFGFQLLSIGSTFVIPITSKLHKWSKVNQHSLRQCPSLLVSLDDFEGKDVTLHPKRKLRCESPQFPFKENPIIST